MINVQKQNDSQQLTIIRAASGNELTDYERQKLAGIEERAQQNKIESIRVNGTRAAVDTDTKTAQINLGTLAFKNTITSAELDPHEQFFIQCELD